MNDIAEMAGFQREHLPKGVCILFLRGNLRDIRNLKKLNILCTYHKAALATLGDISDRANFFC